MNVNKKRPSTGTVAASAAIALLLIALTLLMLPPPRLVTAQAGDLVLYDGEPGSVPLPDPSCTEYAAGDVPYAAALGDVDGDGDLDLVTANHFGNSVSVLLGRGDGSFEAPTGFAVGREPTAVALADVDGDGDLGIVTANHFDNSVSVLLGNGDGSFATSTDYVAGGEPSSMALGDLDRDGDLDIVTANRFDNSASVLLGRGDGTFATRVDYATADRPGSVALGDVDGDGDLDLVATGLGGLSGAASVLLGNGDGTFAAKIDYEVGDRPVSVALGDVDGDGDLDLVTASDADGFAANSVSVLLGAGDGTFAARRDYGVGENPGSVTLRDVDGDGDLDLLVANRDDDAVSVLLGAGDGTFVTGRTYHVGRPARSAALGDLNGDAILDLVTAHFDDTVSVLRGLGDGTFTNFTGDDAYPVGRVPDDVALGDLNRDGNLDIVAVNFRDDSVAVLLGAGDGTFGTRTDYAVGREPTAVALGDVDGDGGPDIVTENFFYSDRFGVDSSVSVLLGRGDGTFAGKTDYTVGESPLSVALGDLDGDGDLDVATANAGDPGSSVLGDGVSVLLGAGDGTFPSRRDYDLKDRFDDRLAGVDTRDVALGDVDGDGDLDILTANAYTSWNEEESVVSLLLGVGDDTFYSGAYFAGGPKPMTTALGDLNGDGVLDIIMAKEAHNTSVLLGLGGGIFGPKTLYTGRALALGDLDGDSDLDLVTANLGGSVSPRLNRTIGP